MKVVADCYLRRKWHGKRIGYRVLDSYRRLVSPWTDKDVFASPIPGHFMAVGGVELPDDGGVIVWGTEAEDAAEKTVDPLPPQTVIPPPQDLAAPLEEAVRRIIEAIPAAPDIPNYSAAISGLRGEVGSLRQRNEEALSEQMVLVRNEIMSLRDLMDTPKWLVDVMASLSRADASRILPDLSERLQTLSGALEARLMPLQQLEAILGLVESLEEQLEEIIEAMSESAERDRLRDGIETLERAVRKYYAVQG